MTGRSALRMRPRVSATCAETVAGSHRERRLRMGRSVRGWSRRSGRTGHRRECRASRGRGGRVARGTRRVRGDRRWWSGRRPDGVLGDALDHADDVDFLVAELTHVGDAVGGHAGLALDLAGEDQHGDGIGPGAEDAVERVDAAGAGGDVEDAGVLVMRA